MFPRNLLSRLGMVVSRNLIRGFRVTSPPIPTLRCARDWNNPTAAVVFGGFELDAMKDEKSRHSFLLLPKCECADVLRDLRMQPEPSNHQLRLKRIIAQ